jgi:hypothetical protein
MLVEVFFRKEGDDVREAVNDLVDACRQVFEIFTYLFIAEIIADVLKPEKNDWNPAFRRSRSSC